MGGDKAEFGMRFCAVNLQPVPQGFSSRTRVMMLIAPARGMKVAGINAGLFTGNRQYFEKEGSV
jgi:hypothetical protein